MNISVIGAGGWGTTFAELLGKKGFEVLLWVHSSENFLNLMNKRENEIYLKGVKLSHIRHFTMDLDEAISFADLIIIAIPTQKIRTTIENCKVNDAKKVIILSKGLEMFSFRRVSQIIKETWGLKDESIFVLSGPNFSYEIAREMPAATVIGGKDIKVLRELQEMISTDYFRVYYSTDCVGVELGGALKNVYAIACGISDGLGFGDSSKASLITRSLTELVRLGVSLGGKRETFFGLSGAGDLIATSFSKRSRNRWAGEQIGLGKPKEQIENSTKEVIEGFYTLKAVFDLNKELQLELPIVHSIYRMIYELSDTKSEILSLMKRPFKEETT